MTPEDYEEKKLNNPEPEPETEEIVNIQESEISEIVDEPELKKRGNNHKRAEK